MLWLFSSDILLHVLSFLEFKEVLALYLLSRDIHQYLADHEVAIFHQLAILHRFVSIGTALDDAIRIEEPYGDWLKGVHSWKELCMLCSSALGNVLLNGAYRPALGHPGAQLVWAGESFRRRIR